MDGTLETSGRNLASGQTIKGNFYTLHDFIQSFALSRKIQQMTD